MNILENEFIHIGTYKIYKELWQNIRTDQTYPFITKPYGGLYCSKINEELCDWLSYVRIEKNDYYNYVAYKPACIIKIKNTSNLLKIENENDIKTLENNDLIVFKKQPITIDKYYYKYNIDFLPNYEKISNIYDVIYINPYLNNAFKEYSIPTILITNPDSIEYYKPIIKEYETISDIKSEEKINELSIDYYKYYKYIENKFNGIETFNYNEFIKKLNILRDIIISDKNNLYTNLNFKINSDINNQQLLNAVTHNIYREKYLLKQKVLHK